ncbi:hypothetical protein C672_1688 [[Clostridium] bifermentans ATCC 638]|uniref:Uncharacterized protein n=1 Tax=Paraclostridium bifermentans ATCC 638 = DSM 14991 TaxID=1233171 RepID=T4VGA1_PARBF|nr:hypothetical protein [Paraclostridium bifermentans]EQK42744.1 hypothetical protein C672_1688 [[Clostridium] bifermentans ATCC 638] [Paraclostridium bifermentans ATCC 638 = DSM 14991]RIZ58425.1 hypothetical protein CHH45_11405 [Paraclostridium bifermentans]UAG19543.1 hypothetical protein KXZ80_07490 [Paraclostridium bifermentans]
MKIKLPFVLRKTHERVTGELVKDIKVQESAKTAADKKVRNLKLKLERHDYLARLKEKEQAEEIEELKLELEKRDKQIKELKWCIQERDKELDNVKAFNMDLYKKVERATEMQRQVKEKIDIAFNIDVIEKERTEHGAIRTITAHDIKKLLKGEDLVEIYTKLALMV